jgi:SSS family solute:Na+ symporter
VGGCLLGTAAIFSAEVSSADAALFMLSTSLSRDLYQRFLRPEATDAAVLRAARLAAIAGGALGVIIALLRDGDRYLTIFYSIPSVSLFVRWSRGFTTARRARSGLPPSAPEATLLAVRTGGQVMEYGLRRSWGWR